MSKFDELLKRLNEEVVECVSTEWDENLPDEIYQEYFSDFQAQIVSSGLYVDEYRWYSASVTIIKIFGRYLGIRYVNNVYSENMDVDDCGVICDFFEMKVKSTITYVKCK